MTKEQVADFVRANQVEVTETERGNTKSARLKELDAEIRPLSLWPQDQLTARDPSQQGRLDSLLHEWDKENVRANKATKFASYVLPGGENYRELLLTLPIEPGELGRVRDRFQELSDQIDGYERGGGIAPEALYDEMRQLQERLSDHPNPWLKDKDKLGYRSPHWDEPNVLAHVRFNDRTIDGKKTLFIEEVQSDWHQAGKKKGYANAGRASEIKAIKDRLKELTDEWDTLDRPARMLTITLDALKEKEAAVARRLDIADEMNGLNDRLREMDSDSPGVPDAPFKTTWPDLTFKRMIRYAAEHGYDAIAWTPGSVQAERYDLSKQISRVELHKPAGENLPHYFKAYDLDHKEVMNKETYEVEKDLPEWIGKDVAEKLLNAPEDKPKFIERVTAAELDVTSRELDWLFKAPDGREVAVGKGVFAGEADARHSATKVLNERAVEINRKRGLHGRNYSKRELRGLDLKVGGEGMTGFYDRILPATVNKLVKKFGGRVQPGYMSEQNKSIDNRDAASAAAIGAAPVHTLPITPDMRKAALGEGFPLFQQGQPKKRGLGFQNPDLRPDRLSPAAQARFDDLRRMLTSAARMIAGPGVAIGFQEGPYLRSAAARGPAPGYPEQHQNAGHPTGMYNPGLDIIEIALGGPDPRSSVYHEAWHALELRRLHERELAVLKDETENLRPMVQRLYNLHYTQAAQLAGYEVRAYAFQHFDATNGRFEGQLSDPVRAIFARILRVMRRLRNMLRGMGFQTTEDIFSAAYRGEFANREVQEPADLDSLAMALTPRQEWELLQNRMSNEKQIRAAQDQERKEATKQGKETPSLAQKLIPRTSSEQAVLQRIAASDERGERRLTFNRVYTAAKDDLNPIRVLRNILSENKRLPAQKDPYILARLTRGNYGRGEQFIENATYDFDTLENTGPSLKAILAPVENDLDGFRAYAVSKRAVELSGRGIETGVPLDEAKATVEAGKAKYEPIFRKLQVYQGALADFLLKSGILSPDSYRAMVAANKDYVPFFRLMGDSELGQGLGAGLKVRNPVKGIRGSERQIIDPIESIVKNTFLFVSLAERNRALRALADLADASPAGKDFMPKVKPKVHGIEVTEDELNKFLTAEGIDQEASESLTIFRPNTFVPAKDEIALFRNGKREVRKVSPEVAEAVNGMDRESLSLLTKIIAQPARWLRAGAVLSPEFIARNPVRDAFTALAFSKNGFLPVWDTLRGLGAIHKRSQSYQTWLKSGGAGAAMVALDRDYINQSIIALKDPTVLDTVKNVAKTPVELLRLMSELSENSTRIGEMARALKKGKHPFQAGYEAREVTLDFQRIGAQMRALNAVIPFFNATIEGADRAVRAFAERPLTSSFKVALSITLPSLLLWFINKDDDRVKEQPGWLRNLFWIIATNKWEPYRVQDGKGGWRDATDADMIEKKKRSYYRKVDGKWEINNGTLWKIPKPFELGIMFGSAPERALDAYFSQNPKELKHLSKSLIDGLTPSFIPQAILPIFEQITNHSFFLDRPIVPKYLEGLKPQYQFAPYTTETAKLIGGAIAKIRDSTSLASPLIVENYIRQWTGGLGQHALAASDKALKAAGLVPARIDPTPTWADMPLAKAFAVRYPGAGAQSVQDFYEEYDARKKTANTVRELTKREDRQTAAEIRAAQATETAEREHKALGLQSKLVRDIYRNPKLTPEEKRTMIDQIYLGMIDIAKRGLQRFKDTEIK